MVQLVRQIDLQSFGDMLVIVPLLEAFGGIP